MTKQNWINWDNLDPNWMYVPLRKDVAKTPAKKKFYEFPDKWVNFDQHDIGLISGKSSGGTLCIDFDGATTFDWWIKQFPDVDMNTTTWTSGKDTLDRMQVAFKVPPMLWNGTNAHLQKLVVQTDDDENGNKCQIEFRWDLCQSVLPPSTSKYGGNYYFVEGQAIPPKDIDIDVFTFWSDECKKKEEEKAERIEKNKNLQQTVGASDIELLLSVIGNNTNYPAGEFEQWRGVAWATAKCLGDIDEAKALLKHYIPESSPGAYNNVFAGTFSIEGCSYSVGTLINEAKRFREDWIQIIPHLEMFKEEPEQTTLITPEQSNVTIEYMDADCGAGKSHATLQEIIIKKGKWVYACDKIISIQERNKEFYQHKTTLGSIDTWHTEEIYKSEDSDLAKSLPVVEHIKGSREYANKQKYDNVVFFITHAALKMMNWDDWKDWNLVIDEVPDLTNTFEKQYQKLHDTLITPYMEPIKEDKGAYLLQLTDLGEENAQETTVKDNAIDQILPLLKLIGDSHVDVWVEKEGWDNKGKLKFFSNFHPNLIKGFKYVRLLADKAMEQLFCLTWEKQFQVNFKDMKWVSTRKARTIPIEQRATIYYFAEHKASIRKTRTGNPLESMSEYIKKRHNSVLYTANSSSIKKIKDILNRHNDKDITPKAHGRNDLMDFTTVFWAGAMRPDPIEKAIYSEYLGLTEEEIILSRELNAIYQFVMRGTLRDWYSTDHCHVYLWDRAQAEYIADRLGINHANIIKIPGIVVDTDNKGGRPKKAEEDKSPLTGTEATKKSRIVNKWMKDNNLNKKDNKEEWDKKSKEVEQSIIDQRASNEVKEEVKTEAITECIVVESSNTNANKQHKMMKLLGKIGDD